MYEKLKKILKNNDVTVDELLTGLASYGYEVTEKELEGKLENIPSMELGEVSAISKVGKLSEVQAIELFFSVR